MADLCPDHKKKVIGYCGSCVRPLCSKCDASGTVPRCAECRGVAGSGEVKPLDVGHRKGLGSFPVIVVLAAAAAGLYLSTLKGCWSELPAEWQWRHTHTDRKD